MCVRRPSLLILRAIPPPSREGGRGLALATHTSKPSASFQKALKALPNRKTETSAPRISVSVRIMNLVFFFVVRGSDFLEITPNTTQLPNTRPWSTYDFCQYMKNDKFVIMMTQTEDGDIMPAWILQAKRKILVSDVHCVDNCYVIISGVFSSKFFHLYLGFKPPLTRQHEPRAF